MSLSGNLPSMRGMYRAAKGKRLVKFDFDKQELRVRAAVCKDRVLQEVLDSGLDLYAKDAIEWFQLDVSIDQVKKLKPAARKSSKIIQLGSQYAAGPETIYPQGLKEMRTFKWSVCVQLNKAFKAKYFRTVQWWFEEQERVLRQGYSEGRILGFRRTYPREPPLTEIANYPIQTTAAELTTLGQIALDDELRNLPGAHAVTQEHDAVAIECWEQDAATVRAILPKCFSRPVEIEGEMYTFPIEIKEGQFWDEV